MFFIFKLLDFYIMFIFIMFIYIKFLFLIFYKKFGRNILILEVKEWERNKMWLFFCIGFEKDSFCVFGKYFIVSRLYLRYIEYDG